MASGPSVLKGEKLHWQTAGRFTHAKIFAGTHLIPTGLMLGADDCHWLEPNPDSWSPQSCR